MYSFMSYGGDYQRKKGDHNAKSILERFNTRDCDEVYVECAVPSVGGAELT